MIDHKATIEQTREKEHRGGTRDQVNRTDPEAAREMLATFRTLGADSFYVTVTDIGGNWVNDGERTFEIISASLSSLLTAAEARRCNVIIRPITATPLIQLDDLTRENTERVRELAFLVIETSRGNFQAWLAVHDLEETTPGRLKEALDADPNTSGAIRLCGSLNFKRKYAPDFPTVTLIEAAPGRTATNAEILEHGLIAEASTTENRPPCAPLRGFQSRTMPSYAYSLNRAPKARTHDGPDRSWADYDFALTAADRGFAADEIADQLMIVSEKAREKKRAGRAYAEHTAQKAAERVRANQTRR